MRFEQKLAAALALLGSTTMWPSNYAPPLYRLLWRLGARVPPPHFVGVVGNFISGGAWFSVVWGFLMWFIIWSRQGMSPVAAFTAALFAGVFFGLFMAAYYSYGARKHRIPLWRDFQPPDELTGT